MCKVASLTKPKVSCLKTNSRFSHAKSADGATYQHLFSIYRMLCELQNSHVPRSTSSASSCQGVLNMFLPATAFVFCSRAERPFNTLWHEISNPLTITYADMEHYLDLILGFFELSPTGCSVRNLCVFLRCVQQFAAFPLLNDPRRVLDDRSSADLRKDGRGMLASSESR